VLTSSIMVWIVASLGPPEILELRWRKLCVPHRMLDRALLGTVRPGTIRFRLVGATSAKFDFASIHVLLGNGLTGKELLSGHRRNRIAPRLPKCQRSTTSLASATNSG
jgi:hypothetical protein